MVSEHFSAELLGEECHEHFLEAVVGKAICNEHTTDEHAPPSTAKSMLELLFDKDISLIFIGYGYGFLAVFVISFLSLGGLLAFPLIYKVSSQYVLTTFTALAVGTLFGDAMFHLIPFVCIDFFKKRNIQIFFAFSL